MKRSDDRSVWSSGLDAWEPASIQSADELLFDSWHVKTMDGKRYDVARDQLGRWFRFKK